MIKLKRHSQILIIIHVSFRARRRGPAHNDTKYPHLGPLHLFTFLIITYFHFKLSAINHHFLQLLSVVYESISACIFI